MGLAVSQVRLLALTNRKADIELQMQVNSKRKQQLTRKATELSQEYYNRLQNTAIMYATSNGYEDVDFNYVMGVTDKGEYSADFLKDLTDEWRSGTVHKPENTMILTDSFGQVVVNNSLAKTIAKVSDESEAGVSVEDQTVTAIMQFIADNSSISTFAPLFKDFATENTSSGEYYIDKTKSQYVEFFDVFKTMIENYNSSSLDGGRLYKKDNTNSYYSDSACTVIKTPKNGYVYKVQNVSNNNGSGSTTSVLFMNGRPTDITTTIVDTMKSLVEYFAPIFSAAFKNGVSMNLSAITTDESGKATSGNIVRHTKDDAHTFYLNCGAKTVDECIQEYVNSNPLSTFKQGNNYFIVEKDGQTHYMTVAIDQNKKIVGSPVEADDVSKYITGYTIKDGGNAVYENASKVENLQSGLKSGTYQFCIVGNVKRGTYHKNTRLNYFTHKGWVSEKMDSSKREEITAWFNIEQAAISEKETYWDTEIQNLSTELTAVNTEIESVKQLKSNAIKSVFNWGNS